MVKRIMQQNQSRIPKIFILLTIVIATVALGKVIIVQKNISAYPKQIDKAIELNTLDEETVKKYLASFKEVSDNLKKKNMFVPPPPKPKMPSCTGIFGDMAIINGKGYKEGEKAGEAKVIKIDGNVVTIEWEGAEKKLYPFSSAAQSSAPAAPPSRTSKSSRSERPERPSETERPGGPPRGRFGFEMDDATRQRMMEMRQRYENASPEERERMRSEFRERMGFEGRGSGRGGGDRGGRGGEGGGRGR